jgi:hypothetical protein
MRSDLTPEMKRTTGNPAKPAQEMQGSVSILFIQDLKKSLWAVKSAGNAGLAGCFILNVRKDISLMSSSPQLGCTPPQILHFLHPRFFPFFYANLHPTRP